MGLRDFSDLRDGREGMAQGSYRRRSKLALICERDETFEGDDLDAIGMNEVCGESTANAGAAPTLELAPP